MNEAMESPSLNQIKHLTKRELAYYEIRRGLFIGKFRPGSSVTVSELSKQLNLGIMPVREAIQQLAYQGAFELLPNRSISVPVHNPGKLDELYQARMLVECFAAGESAKRMTESSIAELRETFAKLLEALDRDDPSQAQLCNFNFHFGIYHHCNNQYVIDSIERLWLTMGPMHIAIWRRHKDAREGIERILPWHENLIDVLAAGNASDATKLMKKMLVSSRKWFFQHRDIFDSAE